MPEHLRALIVVLILSSCAWLAIQPHVMHVTSKAIGNQWRNLWFISTTAAFILGNFWIYTIFICAVILVQRLKPVNALAIYCLLLFAIPAAGVNVPGFGLINYFFLINQPRLLAILALAPAAIILARQKQTRPLGKTLSDKLLLLYLLMAAVLQLRENNITNSLRGCFYLITDIFLPYYVASRAPRKLADIRQVMQSYVVAASILGVLCIFETVRHWNLYAAMIYALGIDGGSLNYLSRDGLLRASGSTGQAIVLGYIMVIGLGFYLFLKDQQKITLRTVIPIFLMAGGLLASLSRGPWLGGIVALIIFTITDRNGLKKTIKIIFGIVAILIIMFIFGVGGRVLNLLPFVGKTEVENITYRQQLIEKSLIVIERNFWLGSTDYLQTPEMQSMIQGQGIIDIVNTYIGIALNYGFLGFVLFSGFFFKLFFDLWKSQSKLPFKNENKILGRCLLAVLAGIVFMIATVSSIGVIPQIYWIVGGLSFAWLEMTKYGTLQNN